MQYNCQKNTHFFGLLPPIAKREQASSALTGSCSRQCLSFRAPRFGENLRKVSLRGPPLAPWGQGAVAISWIISRERHDWVCFSPLCGPVYCHNSFSQRHLRSLWPKLALFFQISHRFHWLTQIRSLLVSDFESPFSRGRACPCEGRGASAFPPTAGKLALFWRGLRPGLFP
jgi:hypothetical protein